MAGKVKGTVVWDSEGYKLVDILGKGERSNAARYFQTLNKLRRALREKRPKKKTVILQHNNGRPHTARLTLQTIQRNEWEMLSHPAYSPDLATTDDHLFGPLKDHLRGHHYETDEAVQEAVQRGAGTAFYQRGMFKILQHWQK
jgi:histone-lysine N-methyltransferase SETMAR